VSGEEATALPPVRRSHPAAHGDVRGWAALLVVYLVWGSTYLAIRVGDRGLPPLVLAAVRFLVAGAVLLATVPLWMALLAVPLQHHRINATAGVGLLVGLGGVGLVTGEVSASGHLGAALVVLGAAVFWGLGSVVGARVPRPDRALLAAAMEMLAGGAILLAAAAASGELANLRWSSVPTSSWLALGYLVVAGSILGFSAYGYVLARLPLSTVSTYAYVNPVVAVALGVIGLHERLTAIEGLGAALVVGSVILTLRPTTRR
jgi:drug/metabolite transporter (DMT)-like permease